MVSTLIETININAGDFTENFLTCPTCMGPYDDAEHTPKLLPCSHTLCKCCLERIAATSTTTTTTTVSVQQALNNHNSLSRTVAAADAAAAAINNISVSSQTASNTNSPLLQSRLSTTDQCFKCPICRETIIVPRTGGISALPPSFIVNQLLDLVKNQRRDLVSRCINHPNEELLFCETCDMSFCSICESHCRVVSNADHIVIPYSIAFKRMTEIFLFKSNQCINSFNLALGSVQREIETLNSTVDSVAEIVDFSLNELKSLIDKRREKLYESLFRIKESKTKVLKEQMQLIANEKQKVELECKSYQQSNIQSKLLGAQIHNLNEKLDCLRSLFEPRENSFINYEYKFNDVIDQIDKSVQHFGRFKVSSTYPPLCNARIIDDKNLLTSDSYKLSQSQTYSANLAIYFQIQTVDYYGQKRTEGSDPVSILITDPCGRQQSLVSPHQINDLNNGTYVCKFVPNIVGKYRIDISIFLRPINQMPIFLNCVENIDSIWNYGGDNGFFSKGIVSSKGTGDKDFNMPISVRCIDDLIYVLDSGNNRIKILNRNGQFVKHIKHYGLDDTSCTALAVAKFDSKNHLFTINWRSKLLCNYDSCEVLTANELSDPLIQEPIGLNETFSPFLFIIQDKKKLHLCTNTGKIVYESLEIKMKTELNIKNITAFCAHLTKKRIFIADLTSSSTSIYEFDLNWLCDNKLDSILESCSIQNVLNIEQTNKDDSFEKNTNFTFRKYNPNQSSLSTSSSSLNSSISCASSITTATSSTNATLNSLSSASNLNKGNYTSLWHDSLTNKLLAAKCDKQKTVIEIYNSDTYSFEYLIENSKNEKALKRVTSMCSVDGKVVCVDLINNCVKMFKFI